MARLQVPGRVRADLAAKGKHPNMLAAAIVVDGPRILSARDQLLGGARLRRCVDATLQIRFSKPDLGQNRVHSVQVPRRDARRK